MCVCVCVCVFQSALQSSPWGLMQALEQQVGELRMDADDGSCDGTQGDAGDGRPSSGTSIDSNLFLHLSPEHACSKVFFLHFVVYSF